MKIFFATLCNSANELWWKQYNLSRGVKICLKICASRHRLEVTKHSRHLFTPCILCSMLLTNKFYLFYNVCTQWSQPICIQYETIYLLFHGQFLLRKHNDPLYICNIGLIFRYNVIEILASVYNVPQETLKRLRIYHNFPGYDPIDRGDGGGTAWSEAQNWRLGASTFFNNSILKLK